MGSSRKHKEKREKKKHKRDRSRSHEKESHRRKSRKDHDRRKEYHDDTKRSNNFSDEERCFENKINKVSASLQYSDDDLDIERLLDSKLKPEKPEKRPAGESSRKRKKINENDDHIQDVSSNKRKKSDTFEEGGQQEHLGVKEEPADLPLDHGGEDFQEVQEGGQVQLSLSISEANKLRAKLGLKPLDVSVEIPGLGAESSAEQTSVDSSKKEVFVKTENIAEIKKSEKIKEKIKTAKEKRKIVAKLSTVKALGDSDSEEESTASWVKKSRKLQIEKEQAEKRAKLLEEMDAEFGVSALVEEQFEKNKKTYSSKDLKGMVVAHDSNMLKEGQQIILTLKDKGVLDEDDDILQNVNLVDEEHYAKNVENKKKKKDYMPYEEEYDEFGILKKKNLLSKYDEEIHGESKKTFVLGSSSQTDKEKEIEMIRMKLKQQQGVTLEMSNVKVASEYYTQGEMVQFKKPKKKKLRKKPGMLKADDLLADLKEEPSSYLGNSDASMKDDNPNSWEPAFQTKDDTIMRDPDEEDDDFTATEDLSKIIIDEDQAEKELHSALHKARRLKQRKSLFAPEKIASEMVKQEPIELDEEAANAGPIVLNSTAEFCRTLGDIPTYGLSGNRDEEADELLDFERELMEERQRQELEAQNRGAWNEVNMDETPGEITMRENEPILEEEPDITIGVAGALKLAQKKGYLDKESKKLLTGPRASQLQAKSYTIEEKFYEDDKFGKRDRYTGPLQDFREKSSYLPEVKLEYIDDSGRLLNSKEAFRYLSHKFHGKGPGKNKVDKRMKKLDQDTKLKQMSSTDTPLNTVKLLQAKQKETQSPYIVLSGGSKTLTQTMISKPKYP